MLDSARCGTPTKPSSGNGHVSGAGAARRKAHRQKTVLHGSTDGFGVDFRRQLEVECVVSREGFLVDKPEALVGGGRRWAVGADCEAIFFELELDLISCAAGEGDHEVEAIVC